MTEAPPHEGGREPEASPEVELTYAFDDDADPRTVTLYPANRTEDTTTWITVDVDHAFDLYGMA